MFKAALMTNFILTMDQITTYNVKGVTCSDKSTENYAPTLLASFSSFATRNFNVLVSHVFPAIMDSCFQ